MKGAATMIAPDTKTKALFLNIPLFTLLTLVAQTDYAFSDVLSWFNWFMGSFFIHFVIFIIILLFIFAVLKAPLEVVRKAAFLKLLALLLGESYDITGFIISTSKAFWSLLVLLFIFILPLFLILLLYKAFIKVVKA